MPLFAQIFAFIQLAIKAAPAVKQVYDDAKKLIDEMASRGLITVEEQAESHSWADAHMQNVLEGTVPPEMVVVPDLLPPPPLQPQPQQPQQAQQQQPPPAQSTVAAVAKPHPIYG